MAPFDQYLGRNQGKGFSDPATREGCQYWLDLCLLGYRDPYGTEPIGVDVEIIDGQLPLTEETAEYIYTDFTPLEIKYERGDRPMLERVVDSVIRPEMTEREKVLALLALCRDLDLQGCRGLPFQGGTEEELIKRGATMCNEVARVFCVLAQIAGIPARTYSQHIRGHMMNEVYIEGRWCWMDPQAGLRIRKDDGALASGWELMQEPGLVDRQTVDVWEMVRLSHPYIHEAHPRSKELNLALVQARLRDVGLNPFDAFAVGNYSVWEWRRYTYPWFPEAPVSPEAAEIVHRRTLNRKRLGFPEWYFNPLLFHSELRVPGTEA